MEEQLILLSEMEARAMFHGWSCLYQEAEPGSEREEFYLNQMKQSSKILKDFFGVDLNG